MKSIISALVISILVLTTQSAYSANYYISNTAKGTGDCSSWGNACTLADISCAPWITTGARFSLFADGSNFYLDGGVSGLTYTSTQFFNTCTDTRSWSKGVTFATGAKSPSPAGHDGYVTFDGQGSSNVFFYMIGISRLKMDGEKNGAINWKFYNQKLDTGSPGDYKYAVSDVDSGGFTTKYITIKYLWLDKVSSGMSFLRGSNVEIAHNKFTNVYHEAVIDARGFPSAPLGTNKIHHNEIENAGDPSGHTACGGAAGAGPDGIQANDVDIYNNLFTTRIGTTYGCQHPDQIQGDWVNVRVYNNRFVGTLSLFQNGHERTSSYNVSNVFIYNNVIIGFANGAQFLLGGYNTTSIRDVYFVNNTYLNTGLGGFTIPGASAVLSNVHVSNNIFHGSGWNDGGGNNEVTPAQCAAITYSNNIVNNGWLTCRGNAVTNQNGQSGMPSFVAYSENGLNSDVHLTASDTAAKDRGISLPSITNTDFDGTSRPQGSAWDIGAYEYVAAGPKPASPGNLSVVK